MRRLMLLRHAKSDWSVSGQKDHDRTLASRGQMAAPLMGHYMASHALVPDHAIVSTSARTRETWQLAAEAFPKKPPTSYESQIYEAEPDEILAAIADAPPEAKSLLVVGHNPGFQETAALLIGTGDAKARAKIAAKFPTAALAVIDFDVKAWTDVRPGKGRLERFITPRAIGDNGD